MNQQISIINHVAGHNDYSSHSVFAQIRNADPVRVSLEFFDDIEKLYQNYDHDEVAQWIQFLFSFEHLQDLSRNTFEEPSKFDPSKIVGVKGNPERIVHSAERYDSDPKNPYMRKKHPAAPTPSVLQFLVHNLPEQAPEWKRASLAKYEKMVRVLGFYTADKYFNEGWATLMMEVLAGHSSFSTDQHMFDYMDLLQGVSGRQSLSNPYWLGREAIRVVRKRFNAGFEEKNKPVFDTRPETLAADPTKRVQLWARERDRAFIDFFHKKFMRPYPDYDNLLQSLDSNWIYANNYFLYRKAEWNEIDRSLPPPIGPDGQPLPYEQKIIVSTDASRITYEMAKSILDFRFKIPRTSVDDANAFGRGVLSLKHEMVLDDGWRVHGMPLKLRSTAQVLYLLALTAEKPVSLETVHIRVARARENIFYPWYGWYPGPMKENLESRKIRVEVEQTGKVRVYVQPESLIIDDRSENSNQVKPLDKKEEINTDVPWKLETEVLDSELSASLQAAVDSYKEDQELSVNDQLAASDKDFYTPHINAMLNNNLNGQFRLLDHAPTAPRAIAEYKNMLTKRLAASLKRAMEGKIKSRATKGGLRFRVMPLVPTLEFDNGMLAKVQNKVPASVVDPVAFQASFKRMREASNIDEHLKAEKEVEGFLRTIKEKKEFSKKKLDPVINTDQILTFEIETMNGKEQIGRDRSRRKKGDKVWGPGDGDGDGSGDREANDDDEDKPQPGDDPAHGQDDSHQDPTEIDVPIDVVSAFLREMIELPRLKPKTGLTDITYDIREGAVRKPAGQPLYSRMFPSVLVLGRNSLIRQGIDPDKLDGAEIAREGMKFVQQSHVVVKDREEVQIPDVNAFVLIAIDLSGSMWGWPIEASKKFMFNLNAALKTKYKNIKFAYTSLDGKGKIYYNEEEFWKAWFGGGTDYSEGFKSAEEELHKYNPSSWDRYYIPIGDSGTGNPAESIDLLKKILDQIEYTAYIHVNQGYSFGGFQTEAKRVLDAHPYGGYAELDPVPGSDLVALRTLFGKNRAKK
ncbi:MAG: hypothetical protein JWQ35_1290 [Bacteriovoracaceae bacterium]|nr:hypothetical protein [Bacteriovoracaceae bacterium]